MCDEYLEATLIVGGAVDAMESFTDPVAFDTWLASIQGELRDSTETVEVYSMQHPHSPNLDCECAQYASDHRPYWENAASKEGR